MCFERGGSEIPLQLSARVTLLTPFDSDAVAWIDKFSPNIVKKEKRSSESLSCLVHPEHASGSFPAAPQPAPAPERGTPLPTWTPPGQALLSSCFKRLHRAFGWGGGNDVISFASVVLNLEGNRLQTDSWRKKVISATSYYCNKCHS